MTVLLVDNDINLSNNDRLLTKASAITSLEKPSEVAAGNNHAPLFLNKVPCGFPSPADDFSEDSLNLNEYLIKHPKATFFARAEGHSMRDVGIADNDLLVVDRAMTPRQDAIVIIAVNGELMCKQLDLRNRQLLSANSAYAPIAITDDLDTLIEGTVIWVIKNMTR